MKHTSKNNMKNTISSKKIKQKHSKQKIPNNKKKTKTNDSHFSTKTGTKCRNKSFEKMLIDTQIAHMSKYPLLLLNNNKLNTKYLIKHLEKIIVNNPVKLTDKYILNGIRDDLENDKSCEVIRDRIKRTTDDDIIMELNKDTLKSYRKNLYILILSLHRINLPDDLIELITNEGLKLIVPETNIYKIIPDNLLIDIQKIKILECEYNDSFGSYFFEDNRIMNEKKSIILEKYSGESNIYYEFVKCILMNISKNSWGYGNHFDNLFTQPRRFLWSFEIF